MFRRNTNKIILEPIHALLMEHNVPSTVPGLSLRTLCLSPMPGVIATYTKTNRRKIVICNNNDQTNVYYQKPWKNTHSTTDLLSFIYTDNGFIKVYKERTQI